MKILFFRNIELLPLDFGLCIILNLAGAGCKNGRKEKSNND